MFKGTLLRSSRALSSRSSSQAAFTPFRTSSPFFRATEAQAAPTRIASRWYSESAEAEKKEEAKPEGDAAKPTEAETRLKEELEKKNKEVSDFKDKYLRQVAETRNIQERAKRDQQAAKDFAIQRFAKDLVDSVDNLERALTTVPADKLTPDNQDLVTLYDGLKMTESILMSTLKKHGLERFDPSADLEKFNPNIHEAVFHTPQPDKEDGVVFHTQQKGYMLNSRVLRPAKVGVVKNA